MSRYIIGIDPGLGGALSRFATAPGAFAEVIDMPTLQTRVNGKMRRRLDEDALARWFDLYAKDISLLVIEKVGPSPRDSKAGAFSFGDSYGLVRGMAAANFIPRHYVPPQKWKGRFGLSSDKDASRALASRMFPAAAHLWPNKGHDGRAEAALLAWYGLKLKEEGVA